jgi:NAD(P)H-dependent FMN reductase
MLYSGVVTNYIKYSIELQIMILQGGFMKLLVIVGATRPGRSTDKVAKWVVNEASVMPDVTVELVDLVDYEMPFFNEAISPRYNPERHPEPAVQKWLDKISSADAYIFVTPEYNHAPAAVLKNAIDFLTYEMNQKPATVVAHGSVGGARATMMLKEILSESRATIIPSAVALVGMVAMGGIIDENGAMDETLKANPYGPEAALKAALIDLKWHSDAMVAARA